MSVGEATQDNEVVVGSNLEKPLFRDIRSRDDGGGKTKTTGVRVFLSKPEQSNPAHPLT